MIAALTVTLFGIWVWGIWAGWRNAGAHYRHRRYPCVSRRDGMRR